MATAGAMDDVADAPTPADNDNAAVAAVDTNDTNVDTVGDENEKANENANEVKEAKDEKEPEKDNDKDAQPADYLSFGN